jgi:HSP20 family protein
MSLTRWDPLREILTLREAMNSLLEESMTRPRAGLMAMTGSVPIDVREMSDAYVVTVPLPGVSPEDVEISVLGNSVRIAGEFKDHEPEESQGSRWLVRERRFGRFERAVTLPAPVSADQASADFSDGILTVRLPRAEESRPKSIPVRGGAQSGSPDHPGGQSAPPRE